MLSRRLFFATVNKELFASSISNRYRMAPVTRNQKKSTSENVVNPVNTNKKVEKKSSTTRLVAVSKQKSNGINSKSSSKDQKTGKDGLPIISFSSQNNLEDWLRQNHTVNTGLWVKIAKKSSGIPTVNYEEMLDAALCYGWIDGQRCGLDETWFLQRITPRRTKSNWSQINREKVKRLIRMGKMQSAGQRLIDEAKADGRWDNASAPTSGCVIPDELVAAVEALSPATIELFRTLSKPSKLVLVNRIEQTTSEVDRNECIRSIVLSLDRGETVG